MPVLAVVSCLVLLSQQEPRHWGLAGLLLGAGLVLHLMTRGRSTMLDEADDADRRPGSLAPTGDASPGS